MYTIYYFSLPTLLRNAQTILQKNAQPRGERIFTRPPFASNRGGLDDRSVLQFICGGEMVEA